MLLTPFHCLLRLKLSSLKQLRLIRTSVQIGKDVFRLTINVNNFRREEIRIKADKEHIKIEGKHERQTESGFIMRKFVKTYKLPSGCDPKEMTAKLSPDGALTITAVRHPRDQFPCGTLIPIKYAETPDEDKFEGVCDPCKKWKK